MCLVTAMITAAIIARDEERHIAHCLDTLAWADALLVVLDERTRDRTGQIAEANGARVVSRAFTTFPAQRNAALDLVTTPWVLFVDADERVPSALAREVCAAIQEGERASAVGFWIPRRNYIWGGWIRHGGWYPDYQLRLLRVANARYDERRDVHELVCLDGTDGYLAEPLIHYNYDRFVQFLAKQEAYSTLEADRLARAGTIPWPHSFVLQPYREFRRRFVSLQGYRDGWRGLVLASLLACYTAVTYAKLARHPSGSSTSDRRGPSIGESA
jgi:glycosyltransferase involved in cell wall biosynthesis